MAAKGGDPRLSCIIDYDAERGRQPQGALSLSGARLVSLRLKVDSRCSMVSASPPIRSTASPIGARMRTEIARLRARADARAILIARDMPVLAKTAAGLDPLLPLIRDRGARRRAGLGAARRHAGRRAGIRRASPRRSGGGGVERERRLSRPAGSGRPRARRSEAHRPALDRGRRPRSGRPGEHAGLGQGADALARAPALLLELRKPDRRLGGGLAARVQEPAGCSIFLAPIRSSSCWRSTATTACSAVSRGSPRACIRRSPVSSSRARRSRRRSGARFSRRPASPAARSAISPRSRGRSRPR